VYAVVVIIADVLTNDAAKVFFVYRDDMVQDLAAATPNPSFGGSVFHGARMFVRFSFTPVASKKAMTSPLKMES